MSTDTQIPLAEPEPLDAEYTVERHFRRSESIAALAAALATAQGQIKGAAKDSANPFFKSKYADLASVMDACKGPLSSNGLAVLQFPRTTEDGVEVETMLAHSSGEWVSGILRLPVAKADAQGVGSAITYARRYSLSAFVGVAPEDDDGNAAAASSNNIRQKALAILVPASERGTAELEKAWKTISAEMRAACKNDLNGLKQVAKEVDEGVAA